MLTNEQREELKNRIDQDLDRIRPALKADGGDVEVLEVTEDSRLLIRLVGACHDCPMSSQTLHQGIEKVIRRDFPEILSVEAK